MYKCNYVTDIRRVIVLNELVCLSLRGYEKCLIWSNYSTRGKEMATQKKNTK